ncbi:hypothetical protein Tco_1222405, partial [Tanacetum coccineum]
MLIRRAMTIYKGLKKENGFRVTYINNILVLKHNSIQIIGNGRVDHEDKVLWEDIINDLNIKSNIDVSNKRAWKGKQLALESNQGDLISSFAQLPYYSYNLKLANENTVTHIDTDHEGRFKMLFIAFGAE